MKPVISACYMCFFLGLMPAALLSQVVPAYPRTDDLVTCFPDTTGYRVITVGPVGRDYADLQDALDAATPGAVLMLDAGAEFRGSFILPDKGPNEDWIILTSSRMDLLPAEAHRLVPAAPTGDNAFPTQAAAMPKIIAEHPSGTPAVRTESRAHHYRLVGLEITVDPAVDEHFGVVNLGDGSAAQNTLDKVPHHIILDRCYIHGHDQGTIMKYGVRLDAAYAAVVDCHISQFHSEGFDTQAIGGINGPGPFKILNNYLEAAGENILFGGAAPRIPGLVPSDIEIRQNHFYKPWSWWTQHPDYAGRHWTIKNHFELKTGRRVWLDGNILENCWADLPIGQSGFSILLTVRTEGGQSPQADVSDVIITNNIVRHAGAGLSVSGTDGPNSMRSSRILIQNNLFEDINGPLYGDQNIFGPNDGTFLKIGEPRDVWIDHNTIFQTGPVTWAYDTTAGFAFTNNITQAVVSAGGYQGIYGPGQQQGNNTFARYFPDVTDAGRQFDRNVLIGAPAFRYSDFSTISQNAFPPTLDDVGFLDHQGGTMDYHRYALSPGSPFSGYSADGRDPGVDMVLLDSAFQAARGCEPLVTRVKDADPVMTTCRVYPNPVSGTVIVEGLPPDGTYILFDLMGRQWLRGRVSEGSCRVDVSQLPPAAYVLAIDGRGYRQHCRVFVR
jgi:hypothetical protein